MSLTRALNRGVQQHPDETYSVFADRTFSFRETQERVCRLASGLLELGLGRDDRAAILAQNSDYYLQVILAIAWADGVVVPVNTRWSVREIADSLIEAEVTILVVDDAFAGTGDELRALVPTLAHIVYAGQTARPAATVSVDDLIARGRDVPDAHRSGEQAVGIFYTGGTTGRSRGVVLSCRALAGAGIGALASAPFRQDDTCLVTAPVFHLAQFSAWFTAMQVGAAQVVTAGFDPAEVLRVIDEYQVRRAVLVPTMLQVLLTHPEVDRYSMSSLQTVVYGGSSVAQATLELASVRLPEANFLQVYGMTEMAATVTVLQPEDHHDARLVMSAGRAAVHTEIKVVDPLTGADLPNGTVGEVLVRGDGMMTEYWRRPSETDAVLHEGWLRTGDAGHIDDEGYLFIVDRVKDMIVSGGENVYSVEVESAIASHCAVAQCAVVGAPDDIWGERVHAFVVLHAGASLTLQDLDVHCRSQIAGYKCPRGLTLVDALPVSGVGKILKRSLRESLV